MIGLWCGIGVMLWIAGCAAYERLWPLPSAKISEDSEPRPLCACSRRGPASMNMRLP